MLLPCVEDDWGQEVYEEEVLAEDEHVRALPLGGEQDDHAGAQPLQQQSGEKRAARQKLPATGGGWAGAEGNTARP